jgi:anti-anti-sigma regulatory factor
MNFIAKKEKDITIVSITGRMDAVTTPETEGKLTELIDAGEQKFVIDFQGLNLSRQSGDLAFYSYRDRHLDSQLYPFFSQ